MSTSPPPPPWADQLQLLVDLARIDLTDGGGIRPTMIAYADDEPLFLATLRPFERGAHHDPIIEVGALAMILGATRLAISLPGRAWSVHDPIPPVIPDVGDLRQRVLVVHAVDATAVPPEQSSALYPILVEDGVEVVGELVTDEAGEGWVTQAMRLMVLPLGGCPDADGRDDGQRGDDVGDDDELARQVVRCEGLGHRFAWGDAALRRVQSALDAVGDGTVDLVGPS